MLKSSVPTRSEREQAALPPRCTLLRPGLVDYQRAWEWQRAFARGARAGADPTLILLEHTPVYTLGARGHDENVLLSAEALRARGADIVRSDRGGDVTFHGPGQIVGYPILDLRRFGQGPVWYVRSLEAILIEVLAGFGIAAERSPGRPGVWSGGEKVAAIGVRISGGVTTHGFALNVNNDLSFFAHIVPCGIANAGVTSMQRLAGVMFDMRTVEDAVATSFGRQFGLHLVESAERPSALAAGATVGS